MNFGSPNYVQKDNDNFWAQQTNNTIETAYKILVQQIKVQIAKERPDYAFKHGFLETCGTSAAVNCLYALGNIKTKTRSQGGYELQDDSTLGDYFLNPNNFPKLGAAGAFDPNSVQANRVFAAYPAAVMAVFGSTCKLEFNKTWAQTLDILKTGTKAIQMCLKDPGHYIAIIGGNDDKGIIQLDYIDSWKARTGKVHCLMTQLEYERNTWDRYLVYDKAA